MATVKSFTDLQQSKKLAEILPIESADMRYWEKIDNKFILVPKTYEESGFSMVPAWSLSALLSVLPNNKHITTTLSRGGWKIKPVEYIDKWFCEYENYENEVDENSSCKSFTVSANNPVDACYEVIIKLYELKML